MATAGSLKTALIIGKFLPPHRGHRALIEFAAQKFDRVKVLVGALPEEPIPGRLRWEWLCQTFAHQESISVEWTEERLPSAPRADRNVSRIWAAYLKARFPAAACLVSSEPYGRLVAEFMGIDFMEFDVERRQVPLSATQIRRDPHGHWDDIVEAARPWFVKKVCLYGPESTGKTTMAERLARHFQTTWVPETARDLIDGTGFPLTRPLIDRILEAHAEAIETAGPQVRRWLFVDSDFLTTQIYSRRYLGYEPPISESVLRANAFDLYLLFEIDVPWVSDPQRMEADSREEMFRLFKDMLEQEKRPYVRIGGDYDQRFAKILQVLEDRFGSGATEPR